MSPTPNAIKRPYGRAPIALIFRLPVLIFLIAILLRTAVVVSLPDGIVWPDGERYEHIAINLLEGHGFGGLGDNRRSVPTQPILIAAVFSVFGKSYVALRIFFAILGAVTCVLGYALAKRLLGSVCGVITGLLLATYPYFIYISALFEYPQVFFILVMAVFFLLLYQFLDSKRKSVLFLSGFSLGLGILSVPTVLIYVPFVFLHILSKSFAENVQRFAIVLIAISIPVGSWVVRNYIAYDDIMLVNAAGGSNFWTANNETYYRYGKEGVIPPCAPGRMDTPYCKKKTAQEEDLRARGFTGKQYVQQDEAESWSNGLQFIRNSPGQFFELIGRKFLEFWSPIPNAVHKDAAHGGSLRDLISIVSYGPVLLLGLWGAVLSIARWRTLMPIYTYFLALTAPYCVFLPTTRYRLPLDFFLIVFAAFALAYWWEKRGRALFARLRIRGT